MHISKQGTCLDSIKYSQILESLSLRGGVKRKAYAPPTEIMSFPYKTLHFPGSLSTLQHPLSFPIMTLFHSTEKTQKPRNWYQLILSPPNLQIRSSQCSVFLLGERSPEKLSVGSPSGCWNLFPVVLSGNILLWNVLLWYFHNILPTPIPAQIFVIGCWGRSHLSS